jgi:tRNA methyl transferase
MLQVCEQAGVALQVVPLTEAYWQRVVAHSIAEIKAGRTPNPDIMCNSRYCDDALVVVAPHAFPVSHSACKAGLLCQALRLAKEWGHPTAPICWTHSGVGSATARQTMKLVAASTTVAILQGQVRRLPGAPAKQACRGLRPRGLGTLRQRDAGL